MYNLNDNPFDPVAEYPEHDIYKTILEESMGLTVAGLATDQVGHLVRHMEATAFNAAKRIGAKIDQPREV